MYLEKAKIKTKDIGILYVTLNLTSHWLLMLIDPCCHAQPQLTGWEFHA